MSPVNGCSVTCNYARLGFHMAAPLEKEVLAAEIGAVIARIEKKSAMTRQVVLAFAEPPIRAN
ncbi:hypothetical protein [Accumulibacter sp.]|jgi:hypothetical protein|uniref:hypothetical protein n=1 Tax=Candidatus Accumulibacter TaxID=327159 RepID=UPI00031B7917|nr:hypothetical protein [Accumulibacter sp.]MBN8499103.1 hypothetical protein [Accumulibacter sp.]MBO3717143.1 hypothetical protein [Accumulibacter sp.]